VLVASGQGGTSGLRTLTTVRPVGLWLAAIWALFYGIFLSLFAESSASYQT